MLIKGSLAICQASSSHPERQRPALLNLNSISVSRGKNTLFYVDSVEGAKTFLLR